LDKTAERVEKEATDKGVLVEQEQATPEPTTHRLTQQGLRDYSRLAWTLLDDSMSVRNCLSETGRKLAQLVYARHLANQT
jgi:hypothetical protein